MKFIDAHPDWTPAVARFWTWASNPDLAIDPDDGSWEPYWECYEAGMRATAIFNMGCTEAQLEELKHPTQYELPENWQQLGQVIAKSPLHTSQFQLAGEFLDWALRHRLPQTDWVTWWRCFLHGCLPQ